MYDDLAKLYDFENLELPENEAELVANKRFEKKIRLNQLGIYIDETYHVLDKHRAVVEESADYGK